MRVGVVGTGYVGLVTGASIADHGHEVYCVDNDQAKIELMQQGITPIYEEGLDTLMKRNIREGRLHFTTDLREGVLGSAAVFLALPTPENEDGSADLSHILGVAKEIGATLTEYTVVVNKSTVPVGTAAKVREVIAAQTDVEFDVVSNPEFLREGQAVKDVRTPDRIVVGTSSERAREVMVELYDRYVRNGRPLRIMSEVSAELTKYMSNGFLATKVSFINEGALLAEAVGADILDVVAAMGDDPRIGKQFMQPSLGWGGSCFPKDSRALIHIGKESGVELEIMEAADRVNDHMLTVLPQKIEKFYEGRVKDKRFGVWGLAFKKNTDDIRESPAIKVVEQLLEMGAEVIAYDPEATEKAEGYFDKSDRDNTKLVFVKTQYEALKDADALVIATDWEAFDSIDAPKAKRLLKAPVIFDGRLLLKPGQMAKQGFYYETIGRPVVNPHVQ